MSEEKKKEAKKLPLFEPDHIPPNDEDIEKRVLADIIVYEECLHSFLKITKGENIFYHPGHRTIFEAILTLSNDSTDIDLLVVKNQLNKMHKLEEIGGYNYLFDIQARAIGNNIQAHTWILLDKYIWRFLIEMFNEGRTKCYEEEDYNKIIDELHAKLDELEKFFEHDQAKTMHESLDLFLMSIVDRNNSVNFYRTGYTQFDKEVTLRPRMMLTIIGTEGCGKSKYARALVKGVLKNNKDVSVLIVSGEESFGEVVSDMMSEEVGLSKKQIGGIDYKLSDLDIESINKAATALKTHNIEVYDHSINTIKLRNLCKKFVKKHGEKCVFIIDNLGCIDTHVQFKDETAQQGYISGIIRKLRDETNGCFLVVHHVGKEADSEKRKKEGYRPRKDLARGSKKIIDDSNMVLLVNMPKIYDDLYLEEKNRWKKPELMPELELTRENYNDYLWALNPNGDKETTFGDVHGAGWRFTQDVCNNKYTYSGKPITLGFLVMKYKEYIASINKINEQQEQEKFYKPKWSVYSFLAKSMFNYSYNVDKTGRDYYLYGNSSENEGIIENLFLVDAAKVRDASKGTVLRYIADLEHGVFTEWNTNI